MGIISIFVNQNIVDSSRENFHRSKYSCVVYQCVREIAGTLTVLSGGFPLYRNSQNEKKVTKEISPTLFREKTTGSILSGWKLSIALMLLVSVLAFSASITSVNARQYIVTFGQTGLDASATGTVVTVDNEAKTYADLPFEKWVNRNTQVWYAYEEVVSSSVPGMRYSLDSVSGRQSPIEVSRDRDVTGNYATQYGLTVISPYDTPSGEGWYDAGSTAYATLATGNVGDGAGIRYIFTGWTGNASGSGLQSNAIKMNGA